MAAVRAVLRSVIQDVLCIVRQRALLDGGVACVGHLSRLCLMLIAMQVYWAQRNGKHVVAPAW